MRRLGVLVALAAASMVAPAHAGGAGGPSSYSYGIDGYEACTAAAGRDAQKQYVCADRLVFELTDGGQLRRLPYCYAYAVEGVFSSIAEPVRRQFTCAETWLGTDLEPR